MAPVWLLGSGDMAVEYSRVLSEIGIDFITIGRSKKSGFQYSQRTGFKTYTGGLPKFLKTKPVLPKFAIIAVSIESLSSVCETLIELGVENILLEKPGVGEINEIDSLIRKSRLSKSNILLAYNRRFYSSVKYAKNQIVRDGGVLSFRFEFTEWSHQIRNLNKNRVELENWFLGNSTHVIDTAFFLCGLPKEIKCYHKGGNDWHPKPTIFSGAGICENGALFSYDANWDAPGRWNIEVLTKSRRYIFRPLEKLQIQEIGSVDSVFTKEIDYSIDEKFKPGLYDQVLTFLRSDFKNFCTIEDQYNFFHFYKQISGY